MLDYDNHCVEKFHEMRARSNDSELKRTSTGCKRAVECCRCCGTVDIDLRVAENVQDSTQTVEYIAVVENCVFYLNDPVVTVIQDLRKPLI